MSLLLLAAAFAADLSVELRLPPAAPANPIGVGRSLSPVGAPDGVLACNTPGLTAEVKAGELKVYWQPETSAWADAAPSTFLCQSEVTTVTVTRGFEDPNDPLDQKPTIHPDTGVSLARTAGSARVWAVTLPEGEAWEASGTTTARQGKRPWDGVSCEVLPITPGEAPRVRLMVDPDAVDGAGACQLRTRAGRTTLPITVTTHTR